MPTAPSLHRKALPLAIAIGLVWMSTLVADAVCGSQVLTLGGPVLLSITYPLSGIAMGIAALVQFSSIDHRPRLSVLRTVGYAYAVLAAVMLALVLLKVVPVVTTTAMWLISDQVNMLFPMLLWSLAGDVFNTAEGKKVFGWMMGWVYAAQALGLVVAIVSPPILTRLGLPLPILLMTIPLTCLVIAMMIPRAMRGSSVSQGFPKGESTRVAISGAFRFIRDVSAWRALLVSSTLASIAALMALIGFSTTGERIIGADAGLLQSYFALGSLIVLVGCVIYQQFFSPRLNARVSVAGQMAILPIVAIVGGLLIALAEPLSSLVVLIVGITVVNIPKLSIDENARHEALTLIPDHIRARVALVLELGRQTIGFVAAGLLALIGTMLGMLWLTGLLTSLFGIAALGYAIVLMRRWENSMLNWRLRRRKHGAMDALTWDDDD